MRVSLRRQSSRWMARATTGCDVHVTVVVRYVAEVSGERARGRARDGFGGTFAHATGSGSICPATEVAHAQTHIDPHTNMNFASTTHNCGNSGSPVIARDAP